MELTPIVDDCGYLKDLFQTIEDSTSTNAETEAAIRCLPEIKMEDENTTIEIVEQAKKKSKGKKKITKPKEKEVAIEKMSKGREKKTRQQLTRELLTNLVRHYHQDYVKMSTNIVTSETDSVKLVELTRKTIFIS